MISSPDADDGDSRLRSLILAQSADGLGVPVVLFSDQTLAADAAPDPTPDDHDAEPETDPAAPELFGTAAYELQTALGARLLPGTP